MATSVDASASLDAGLAQADQKGAADPPNPVPAAEPAEPPKPAKVKHSQHGDLIARCNGVFAVKKPSGTSSADVVARVKGALERQLAAFQASGTHEPVSEGEEPKDSKTQATDGTRGGKRGRRGGKSRRGFQLKVGHGGTLDPMASGLLVIGVGTGTKELSTFLSCTKEYVAGGKFGAATDTYDATGKVVRLAPADPALVNTGTLAAKLEEFRGERLQIPPMYSALWIEGKRLWVARIRGLATV